MQKHSISIGPLNAAQLHARVAILTPYRGEPLSTLILALAERLARLEAAQ